MTNDMIADLVVYGRTYTAEKENNGECEAFAIKDGKYIYVGDKKGVEVFIKEGVTKIIDNSSKGLIIPGCTEGHAHFVGVDSLLRSMPGFYASYEELLEIIKSGLSQGEIEDFFISFGFNYLEFCEKQDPKKSYADELELIAPGIPIVLLDNGGHQAICSKTALKNAGVDVNTKVRGGNFLINECGELSGVVTDELVLYVLQRAIDFTKVDSEIYQEACINAIKILHKRGFTNFFDAYINFLTAEEFYKCLRNLDDAGKLNVNVNTSYTIRSYEANEYREKIDYIVEMGEKYKSKHFNPNTLKLFSDGVVESKTGWMLEKYPNPVNGKEYGNIIWTPEELKNIALYANSKNVPVHTHTYGDGACKATIDAYTYAKNKIDTKLPNVIVHVRNIRKEDIDRCAENDIIVCENMIWHVSTIENNENYNKTLNEIKEWYQDGVFEHGYPMKSFVSKGIVVSSSTDAPAAEECEGNIFNIIEVSTTGLKPEFNGVPYDTDELLTVRETLDCLTINGAKQLGIEDKCGSIKVGKNADFEILDTDFLDYEKVEDLRTIHNSKIKSIYFEGKEVYAN